MLSFLFLIVQICFVLFFFYLCLAFLTGAPFVPSVNKTATAMIELSGIQKGATVYDLGSGDGRLLFLAVQKGARHGVGFEINPFLVLYSSLRIFFSPYRKNITVKWKNFWSVNLSEANIIYMYLLPWKMDRLEQKIKKECKKGTVIVSNSFIFPNLTKTKEDRKNHVYVFTT